MHGGEDRAEPDVAPDGAGRQGISELHVQRPAPQVNVCVHHSLCARAIVRGWAPLF